MAYDGPKGKIDDDYYIDDLIKENHKYLLELIETLDEDPFTTIESIEDLKRRSYYITSYSSYLFDYLSGEESFIVLAKNRFLLPELLERNPKSDNKNQYSDNKNSKNDNENLFDSTYYELLRTSGYHK